VLIIKIKKNAHIHTYTHIITHHSHSLTHSLTLTHTHTHRRSLYKEEAYSVFDTARTRRDHIWLCIQTFVSSFTRNCLLWWHYKGQSHFRVRERVCVWACERV